MLWWVDAAESLKCAVGFCVYISDTCCLHGNLHFLDIWCWKPEGIIADSKQHLTLGSDLQPEAHLLPLLINQSPLSIVSFPGRSTLWKVSTSTCRLDATRFLQGPPCNWVRSRFTFPPKRSYFHANIRFEGCVLGFCEASRDELCYNRCHIYKIQLNVFHRLDMASQYNW